MEIQLKFEKAINKIMADIEIRSQEKQKLSELKDLLLSKLAAI